MKGYEYQHQRNVLAAEQLPGCRLKGFGEDKRKIDPDVPREIMTATAVKAEQAFRRIERLLSPRKNLELEKELKNER